MLTFPDFLDPKSFASLWFWICFALIWLRGSGTVLGVPYALCRAPETFADELPLLARAGATATLARWRGTGILARGGATGMVRTACGFALASGLILSGFLEGVEIAQALSLLIVPRLLTAALDLRFARHIEQWFAPAQENGTDTAQPDAKEIAAALRGHRLTIQSVGMITLGVTLFWGMIRILLDSPF